MPCCDWLPVSRDPVVIGRRLPMAASVSRSVSFDTAPACKSNICIYYIINSFSSKRYLPYVLFKSLFRYTGILKIIPFYLNKKIFLFLIIRFFYYSFLF